MFKHALLVILSVLLCCGFVSATPTIVVPGAFSSGTVVVDFLSFSTGTLISNQLATPANDGLTFSSTLGGIYANGTYSAKTGVAVSATNYLPNACPCADVTLSFSTPALRVGFDLFGSPKGTATFTDTNGTITTIIAGDFPSRQFIGVEDLSGIASLTIDAPAPNGFIIDTVWIDASVNAPVPESGTFVMLGTGIIGMASLVLRRLSL